MKITDNVMEDLLILYHAGEASEDTVRLVEAYLQEKPELGLSIPQTPALDEVPVLSEDAGMKSFRKVRRLWTMRLSLLSIGLALFLVWLTTFADLS